MMKASIAIINRDLQYAVQKKGWFLSALARPFLWLFIVGNGVRSVSNDALIPDYQSYLIPGLIAMILLFGSITASLSMSHDKESDIMRMLLLAPIRRAWIVISRSAAAALIALIQALLFIVLIIPFQYINTDISISYLVCGMLLGAIACSSLGMLIAVATRDLKNFSVIMNFLIFPMFFLSSALYPVNQLPFWINAMIKINFFNYVVDMLHHAFHMGIGQQAFYLNVMILFLFIVLFNILSIYFISKN